MTQLCNADSVIRPVLTDVNMLLTNALILAQKPDSFSIKETNNASNVMKNAELVTQKLKLAARVAFKVSITIQQTLSPGYQIVRVNLVIQNAHTDVHMKQEIA